MRVAQVRDGVPEFAECAPLDLDAHDVVELADNHEDRDAGHVSDEHGLGEQLGEEPQPQQPAQDADQPHSDGE